MTSMHKPIPVKMVSIKLLLDKLRHERFERGADTEERTVWELFLEGELQRGKETLMMGYDIDEESRNVS